MTTHYNPDATDESGWLEPYCGVDGDETTSSIRAVSCWECCAVLGMSDERITAQCGGDDFGGEGDVLRSFGMVD